MNKTTKKILLWILDLAINIVVIFGLVLVIQTWIIAPFDVSGASMCNTLNLIDEQCQRGSGEKIIINEALYLFGEPERGDIVVLQSHSEEDDKYFIKRVIGLPGEIVEIKNGDVYITTTDSKESIKIEEPYLNDANKGSTEATFSDFTVFEVPEDNYFLMGDNRHNSTDSRSCFQNSITSSCVNTPEKAFIPEEKIRGKAWVTWWPISNAKLIKNPEYPELIDTKE